MQRAVTSFLIALFVYSNAANATVCRLPGLNGYEKAADRAKQFLPPETTNVSEMAVYIERDPNGSYYFHSNFRSIGAEHVTKIGGEPTLVDLEAALMNIVFTAMPSVAERASLRRSVLTDVRNSCEPRHIRSRRKYKTRF